MAVTWLKLAYETDVITKALMTAKGDILIASAASTPAALAIGTDNHVLTVATDLPNWEAVPAAAAHKDTHDPSDGSDPLDTAAAAEIAGVVAAGVGVAHTFARADHIHQIQAAISDDHLVTVDDVDAANGEIAVFTAAGIEGQTPAVVAASMALDDIGVPDAAVAINGQQMTDMVIEVVADAAGRPDPVVGKICWQTDELAPYMCTVAA